MEYVGKMKTRIPQEELIIAIARQNFLVEVTFNSSIKSNYITFKTTKSRKTEIRGYSIEI